jgi:hypothetical protein
VPVVLALLAKDWKYFVIIALLLGAVGYIYHRGETHIEAADAKAVATQLKKNVEVQNEIKAKVAAAVADYDALAPIPVPAVVPRLVCVAAGGSAVPPSGPAPSGGDGTGASVPVSAEPAGKGFDPAPAVSATGTAADAEIAHLQKKIKLLQDYVAALQAGGLVAK